MNTNLLQFLQDGTGAYSATRLGFLLWLCGVLVVWIVDSVRNGSLAPIDNSVVVVLGILMSGKVVQNFSENVGNGTSTGGNSTKNGVPDLPAAK
jgi:hypothetical protein